MTLYTVVRNPGRHRKPTFGKRLIDWFLYHWTGA